MKVRSKIIGFVLAILLLFTITFATDYIRAMNNKKPVFAIFVAQYNDGGSKKYVGLFYNVFYIHIFDESKNDEMIITEENKTIDYYVKVMPWFVGIGKVKKW